MMGVFKFSVGLRGSFRLSSHNSSIHIMNSMISSNTQHQSFRESFTLSPSNVLALKHSHLHIHVSMFEVKILIQKFLIYVSSTRLFYDKKTLLPFDSLALSTIPRIWWGLKDLLAATMN